MPGGAKGLGQSVAVNVHCGLNEFGGAERADAELVGADEPALQVGLAFLAHESAGQAVVPTRDKGCRLLRIEVLAVVAAFDPVANEPLGRLLRSFGEEV